MNRSINTAIRVSVLTVLWLILSFFMAVFIVRHHESLPKFPEAIWPIAEAIYPVKNAEEVADLEFFVAFGISGLATLTYLVFALMLYRAFFSLESKNKHSAK
jgi:hypothetical protein